MKKFIIKTLFYLIPLYCAYGVYKISISSTSGDTGVFAKIQFEKEYAQYLEKNYLTDNLVINTVVASYEKLQIANASKICTIGDSFSDQNIFGYQNYLAHLLGNKLQNIQTRNGYRPLETAVTLLNGEIIDSSNCQLVIVESVGRYLLYRLGDINFEILYELPEINKNDKKDANKNSELYELFSFIRLRINYRNPIDKHNLKQEYFTHGSFSKILFSTHEDMSFLETSKTEIEKAKENLILLNKKFSEKGIKLIFLIAADKYDVYRPFMTDASLPVDTTTDGLSGISGVHVIDTKPLLQEMVQNGEKDVYMVNDTHWSYKASKAVALKLAHAIDSLGIFQ
jgi:hypothetical protein